MKLSMSGSPSRTGAPFRKGIPSLSMAEVFFRSLTIRRPFETFLSTQSFCGKRMKQTNKIQEKRGRKTNQETTKFPRIMVLFGRAECFYSLSHRTCFSYSYNSRFFIFLKKNTEQSEVISWLLKTFPCLNSQNPKRTVVFACFWLSFCLRCHGKTTGWKTIASL